MISSRNLSISTETSSRSLTAAAAMDCTRVKWSFASWDREAGHPGCGSAPEGGWSPGVETRQAFRRFDLTLVIEFSCPNFRKELSPAESVAAYDRCIGAHLLD